MAQTLKNYAEILSGLPLGKLSVDENNTGQDGIRLIRPQDLAKSSLLLEDNLCDLKNIVPTDDLLKRLKDKHYVQDNDILISSRSTSYHVAMVKSLPKDAKIILNNNLICLRPNTIVQYPEALLVYLNSSWFKEHVIQKEFPKMLSISVNWLKEQTFTLPAESACRVIANAAFEHRKLKLELANLSRKSDDLLEAKLFSFISEESD